MRNVMLDIETLGTAPGSVITSIGAVVFGESYTHEKIELHIDIESSIQAGLSVDGKTLQWWMLQPEHLRKQFATDQALSLREALGEFAFWLPRRAIIWGNGANFDNTLLAAAYERCSIPRPWHWANDRCFRTIKNLASSIPFERSGTHHTALDDAVDQAVHLQKCLSRLQIRLEGDQ